MLFAQVFVFFADGRLRGSAPVLLGWRLGTIARHEVAQGYFHGYKEANSK